MIPIEAASQTKTRTYDAAFQGLLFVRDVCDEVMEQIDKGRVIDAALYDAIDGLLVCAQNAIASEELDSIGDKLRTNIREAKK